MQSWETTCLVCDFCSYLKIHDRILMTHWFLCLYSLTLTSIQIQARFQVSVFIWILTTRGRHSVSEYATRRRCGQPRCIRITTYILRQLLYEKIRRKSAKKWKIVLTEKKNENDYIPRLEKERDSIVQRCLSDWCRLISTLTCRCPQLLSTLGSADVDPNRVAIPCNVQ